MSTSHFNYDDEQDDLETIVLTDEQGKELECYVEHSLEYGYYTYLLLQPVDLPIIILGKESDDEDEEEVFFIEDEEELREIFGNAKAVLGELNLTLKNTAFTLTASGELPPLEEEDILTLEIDENTEEVNPEELQFLTRFRAIVFSSYQDKDKKENELKQFTEEIKENELKKFTEDIKEKHQEEKQYEIYTPLAPLMFFARQNSEGDLELISPEDKDIQPILEELLFDELD